MPSHKFTFYDIHPDVDIYGGSSFHSNSEAALTLYTNEVLKAEQSTVVNVVLLDLKDSHISIGLFPAHSTFKCHDNRVGSAGLPLSVACKIGRGRARIFVESKEWCNVTCSDTMCVLVQMTVAKGQVSFVVDTVPVYCAKLDEHRLDGELRVGVSTEAAQQRGALVEVAGQPGIAEAEACFSSLGGGGGCGHHDSFRPKVGSLNTDLAQLMRDQGSARLITALTPTTFRCNETRDCSMCVPVAIGTGDAAAMRVSVRFTAIKDGYVGCGLFKETALDDGKAYQSIVGKAPDSVGCLLRNGEVFVFINDKSVFCGDTPDADELTMHFYFDRKTGMHVRVEEDCINCDAFKDMSLFSGDLHFAVSLSAEGQLAHILLHHWASADAGRANHLEAWHPAPLAPGFSNEERVGVEDFLVIHVFRQPNAEVALLQIDIMRAGTGEDHRAVDAFLKQAHEEAPLDGVPPRIALVCGSTDWLWRNLRRLNIASLSLTYHNRSAEQPCDLAALHVNRDTLEELSLAQQNVKNTRELTYCGRLRTLDLSRSNIYGLNNVPFNTLRSLDVSGCLDLCIFDTLATAVFLTTINLAWTKIDSIACLAHCHQLQTLNVECCGALLDLSPASSLTSLEVLKAAGSAVRRLGELAHCGNLRTVDVSACVNLKSLEGLAGARSLVEVFARASGLVDVTGLGLCNTLQTVDARDCAPLKGAAALGSRITVSMVAATPPPTVAVSVRKDADAPPHDQGDVSDHHSVAFQHALARTFHATATGESHQSRGCANGRLLFRGPRGGVYYISVNGVRTYV